MRTGSSQSWVSPVSAWLCFIILSAGAVFPSRQETLSGKVASTESSFSGTKLIWAWSIQPDRSVDRAVAEAQELGFNAVGWTNPEVVRACHERGMKAFVLIEPLTLRRHGALPQQLAKGEEKLPGFDRSVDNPGYPFQFGGEPVPGNREVLHLNLACPRDPGIVEYSVAEATRARQLGYDGICWDFVGYRNYRSCECETCTESLNRLRAKTNMTSEAFYLSALTGLYSSLYVETKRRNPDLLIATHVYPVYLPNILYGKKLMVDYFGETVAWFFKPHWSFRKIRTYTRKTLGTASEFLPSEAMPMIGFYGDGEFAGDRKNPSRLELELRILRNQGTRHLMMCELGHLLRDTAAMRVVKASL